MNLTKEQIESRERTMLVAMLLSVGAPITTGIAVILSNSSTQVADFIRRSVELIVLFVSWWVFRYVARNPDLSPGAKAKLERISGLSVATAMACSGIVMVGLALTRIGNYEPGGNVYFGLTIASMGLIANVWFWRRYTRQTREQYSPIINTQRIFYRAKAIVDVCVIAALAAVAINPSHIVTHYIDISGTIAVAAYLLWSAVNTARGTVDYNPLPLTPQISEDESPKRAHASPEQDGGI